MYSGFFVGFCQFLSYQWWSAQTVWWSSPHVVYWSSPTGDPYCSGPFLKVLSCLWMNSYLSCFFLFFFLSSSDFQCLFLFHFTFEHLYIVCFAYAMMIRMCHCRCWIDIMTACSSYHSFYTPGGQSGRQCILVQRIHTSIWRVLLCESLSLVGSFVIACDYRARTFSRLCVQHCVWID